MAPPFLALWKRTNYWTLYTQGLTCTIFSITVMLARRLVINPISDGIKLILIFGYSLFFLFYCFWFRFFVYFRKYSTIINSFRTIRNLVMGNTVARCFWKWISCYCYSVNDNIIEQCSRKYCLLLYVRSDAENNQRSGELYHYGVFHRRAEFWIGQSPFARVVGLKK